MSGERPIPEGVTRENEPKTGMESLRERIKIAQQERIPDNVADSLLSALERSNPYSEKLSLINGQEIDYMKRFDDDRSCFICTALPEPYTKDSLMAVARQVQEKYPELEFTFNQDPENKWFEYTVTVKED